jgi:prepilin-type N-terminal cleavage/methylation domain-containing protein
VKRRRGLFQQRGLSLIELLLAAVILGIGIVGVLKPMLSAVRVLAVLDTRNAVHEWVRGKIWEIQDDAEFSKKNFNLNEQEQVLLNDRPFDFEASAQPLMTDPQELDSLRLTVSRGQGGAGKILAREIYVLFPDRTKENQS